MKILLILFVFGLVLAGCGAALNPTATAIPPAQSNLSTQPPEQSSTDLSRTDEQGVVTVVVKPINLSSAAQTLDFEVSMNTHSINLDVDLAVLATLTTNTGLSEKASAWDAQPGGHHVSGKLSFLSSVNGTPLLKGATELTLTIHNVDAAERTFKWELPQ